MKQEVSPKVVIAIIAIVVLASLGIGWKIFAPHHQSQADEDAYFAAHPEAKSASESMSKMSEMARSGKMQAPPNAHNMGGH